MAVQFYYTVAAHTPHYHEMVGNPICKQIPWDNNEEFYLAWLVTILPSHLAGICMTETCTSVVSYAQTAIW